MSDKPLTGTRIKLTKVEYTDVDRVYLAINELFDVRIIRTDEGIVIDVFPYSELVEVDEPVATTYAFDQEVMTEEDYEALDFESYPIG